MFKIGDCVRCMNASGNSDLREGKEYTVEGFSKYGNLLLEGLKTGIGYFTNRFELVTSSPPTDQELANDYRRLTDERKAVFEELRARGFTIQNIGYKSAYTVHDSGDNLSISKIETKTVTL